jgi:hypothetical protein
MELRLEAFQDTSLTDLQVEPGSTVTAKYFFSDSNHYVFTVSPAGSNGVPVFSWYEVTMGDFNIHTRSREHTGPTLGLPELLATGETDGPFGNYWWEDAMALIGIHEVAAADIQESIDAAVSEAAYAASERLTKRFQRPAVPPPVPDVEGHFAAFEAACQRRAPYCEGIALSWGHDLDGSPGVVFGLAPGTPEQILYQADPDRSMQLYLNGFWTAEHCLEKDLLEQFPDDGWARLGARNAARDLLEIQCAGRELMETQRQYTLQDIDREKKDRLFSAVKHGRPFDEHFDWNTYASGWLQADCVALFEKIREYLNGLYPADPRAGAARQ